MADDPTSGVDLPHCTNHPFRATSSPGGICAFCLQDKLGQLVSSSSSSFIPTSAVASPSPSSFRSLSTTASTSSSLTLTLHHPSADVAKRHPRRGSHFAFLHPKKSPPSLSRSKSSAASRSVRYSEGVGPRGSGFWSFLYTSSRYKKQDRPKVGPGPGPGPNLNTSTNSKQVSQQVKDKGVNDDNGGNNGDSNDGDDKTVSCERKVARSRSVGCGSRSFSGDFFERISTGFGDCALRRVESNREGRRSSTSSARDIVKDRVRCGGIFGGFNITSSSSSSSSSSYWTAVGDDHNVHAKPNGPAATPGAGPLIHGRSRSWGRALASPMRAFTKPIVTSTTTIKHTTSGGANTNGNGAMKAPSLADIPSLLSVR